MIPRNIMEKMKAKEWEDLVAPHYKNLAGMQENEAIRA